MTLSPLRAEPLDRPGLAHGFFTRLGGVSAGVYATLNGGVGSRDEPAAVAENRRRMAAALGVDHLVVPYQIHSAEALVVDGPFGVDRPRVDGVVTRTPGLGLGVTGADCGVVLLADAAAGVIGAVHAGWKGAFGGVLEATVAAMASIGATPSAIVAVLGPTIAQASYEVGPEFVARFTARDPGTARLFRPSSQAGHSLFDLPGFIAARLRAAGVGAMHDLGLDLRGRHPLLQLPTRDPSRRARLRTSGRGHRAGRLTELRVRVGDSGSYLLPAGETRSAKAGMSDCSGTPLA